MKFYKYLESKSRNEGINKIVVGAVIANENSEILFNEKEKR